MEIAIQPKMINTISFILSQHASFFDGGQSFILEFRNANQQQKTRLI